MFCDKPDIDKTLHLCQLLKIDQNVIIIVKNLRLFKFPTKIREGDMVTAEAKYHTNCLVELCNKYRDFCKKQTNNDHETDLIEGMLNMF